MKIRTLLPLLVLSVVASLPAVVAAQALPRTHTPEPTTADITAADLMTRLYIFAADSMQGREAGTIGNVKGTDYIASEAKRIGLEPAGDAGTYFQTVPYKMRTLADASTIEVNGHTLHVGDDFLPAGGAVELKGVPIVYGGTISENGPPITEAQAQDKVVVLTAGADANMRRLFRMNVPGARVVAVVGLDQLPEAFRGYFLRPQGFIDDPAAATKGAAGAVILSSAAANGMFDKPLDQLEVGASGGTADFDIRYDVKPMPYPSRNVVGILRGSDPKLAGEYVAIGAHNDHIGIRDTPVDHDSLRIWNHVVRPEGADDGGKQATPEQQAEVGRLLEAYRREHPGSERLDSIANGADDDGSGSVTVLEIAEKMASMNPRPKRSTIFVWHVGEEKGLLGSAWFTDHATVPRDSIVAQLNMDMVGRGGADDETGHTIEGEPHHGGPNYVLLVGSRRLSTELGDIVEEVNKEEGHDLNFDYMFDAPNHPSNIYGRSDHYMYARYGIPIVFFTTGLHSDYHQVTDEPEYIDYPHMAKIGNLVEDVAVHLGNLDHRPKVDHPITDSN